VSAPIELDAYESLRLVSLSVAEADRPVADLVGEGGGRGWHLLWMLPADGAGALALVGKKRAERPTSPTVLVVDDNEEDLLRTATVLEQAGFDVRRADSIRDAAVSYVERPAHVLVTDILMPEGDGIDLIQGLRRIDADLPIVAVSGRESGLDAAKEMGAGRILTKPVDPEELVRAVREVIGGGVEACSPSPKDTTGATGHTHAFRW